MKMKLTNGKSYTVSLVTKTSENELCIGFVGIQSYDDLRANLNPETLSVIKYYPDDNTEAFDTYENYTQFVKASTTESEDGTLDVAIYLEKPDEITILKNTVSQLDNTVAVLGSQVNPSIDIDTCTLEELKVWQINLSKKKLEAYLENNPIRSTAHGDAEKTYSITKEKQTLLTQMILVTQLAQQAGEEYQPSWNAQGEPCTYNWTLAELQRLAFEAEAVVRPLVSHQQTMEATINAAETKEAVLDINITF